MYLRINGSFFLVNSAIYLLKLKDYHTLQLKSCFFGMTTKDLEGSTFKIEEKNKIPHHFNKYVGMAG